MADYDTVSSHWFDTRSGQVSTAAVSLDFVGPLTLAQFEARSAGSGQSGLAEEPEEQWIVRLTPQATALLSSVNDAGKLLSTSTTEFRVIRGLGLPGQLLVEAPGVSVREAELALESNRWTAYFGSNRAVSGQVVPDDTDFTQLWGLNNSGQTGGTSDADIDAPEAWEIATGSSEIVIGVIDSGVDPEHPDLYLNIWLNQGEIPPAVAANLTDVDSDGLITFADLNDAANASYVVDLNGNGYVDAHDLLADSRWADGNDTDGNLYVDDFFGWDFQDNDNDPMDDSRHGTHVAGTIAATGDNGVGVTGVNWSGEIMSLRFLDENNQGSTDQAIMAINYATMMREEHNVNVLLTNNSWGYRGSSDSNLRAAIQASDDAGMLFVAAAGNGDALGRGIDNDEDSGYAFYPASEDLQNIISVAATDSSDRLARFSNFGPVSVDIAAPGTGIVSTEPGGRYKSRYGTSMATPHVSGAAALLWSHVPDATAAEVRDAILLGADPIAELQGKLASGGRLNVHGTLLVDTAAPQAALTGAPDITGPGDTEQLITVSYTDNRALDATGLSQSDIVVTRLWDAYEMPGITLDSVDVQLEGRLVTAVYRLPAPDGAWGTMDDGDYEISLRPDEVYDESYNYAQPVELGTFNVDTTEGLFRVDSFHDAVDANPGNGVSDDGTGKSTLRAAVMEANATAGDNVIRLRPGRYTLSIGGGGEDDAETGDLDITDNLTIRGAGANKTTIDAAALDRLFHVLPRSTLTLSGVTITNGSADSGGGILNAGTLIVTDSTVQGNASGGTGGGIANEGTATITQSTLAGNSAVGDGGGFHSSGTASITNSTVSGNWTTGDGSSGGGISNQTGASLALVNNTIAQNTAMARGGGIDTGGTADITNTIVADNTAPLGPDIYGTVISQGYNLIGEKADSTGWLGSDLLDTDALLGPLDDNGGPTLTHALLPQSPAVDAGTDINAPAIDQRGTRRPQDGDGDGTDTPDIGAVERFLGEIHGVRFRDFNGDGIQDPGEPGLAELTMYLDQNNNGRLDPGEPTTETGATGAYSFIRLEPGAFAVAQVLQDGWEQTLENLGLEIELASRASGGLYGDGNSGRPSVSADGRYVAFYSAASNLVRGDTNHQTDVFVYDRQTETIERVSVGSDNLQANEASSAPSISADGRFVAFQSLASNLVAGDTNDAYDVFVFDRQTDAVQRVSPASDGSNANGASSRPSISADGRYVAFSSEASNLIAEDTNGESDIFVYDRQSDTTERVSQAWDGSEADDRSLWASVTADGRYVAYYSYASNLVPDDTNGSADVFVFDRQTQGIERVSVASDGSQADDGSFWLAISADGRFVTFDSLATNLVEDDTNDTYDVFVFDRESDAIERVSVAGDGSEANFPSYGPSISADGQYVAFHSYASNLVPDDTNMWQDVFVYDRQGDTIERVSLALDGSEANNHSLWASVSADGRHVAFESRASNLVPSDVNARTDIFVHDWQLDTVDAVSLASYGPQGNDDSDHPAISADGRYVAFSSRASNLVPDDNNDEYDVFIQDRVTDKIERVSIAADGSEGDAESGYAQPPSISADGRYVAFASNATNLVPEDENYFTDVFVYDREEDAIERVSLAHDGAEGNWYSSFPSISADGRYVAFQSVASNLVPDDGNGAYDIFVFDRETGALQRLSLDSNGSDSNNQSSYPSISADGRYVAFQSLASNLVEGDTNDTYDVFVFDRETDAIERVSLAFDGSQGNGESTRPSISADGRYVTFSSGASNFVPNDTNDEHDVFVYDRETGTIERVSVAADGSEGNAASSYAQAPSISAYGRYVVFASSADNLVPGDENFFADVFVFDRQTDTIERVGVAADDTEANWTSSYPSISADGRYMAFESLASNLVSADANEASDVFVTANMAAWRTGAQTVSVAPGEIVSGIDFGNRPLKGEIHGQKFYDLDRDGFKDSDELGLKDWTVYLDSNGNGGLDPGEPSTLTDAVGAYSFTDLAPLTTYTVAEVQQEFWVQTFPRLVDGGTWTVEVDAGDVVTDVNFGNDYRGPGGQDLDVITGRYFRDTNQNGIQDTGEPGLEGRTVYLDLNDNGQLDGVEPWTVTDSEGGYSIDGLAPGTYTVRSEPIPDWAQTAPLKNDLTSKQFGDGELDQTQSVAVGDFDGDLDNDLAVANGNYVSLLMNDGTGSFGIPINLPLGTRAVGAQSVAAGYFDDDENLDLAVANYLSSNLSVLLGEGDGAFAAAVVYPVGIFPRSVAVGDLDGDGDTDLAVANEYDGNLSILRNDGSGSFVADPAGPIAETSPFHVITGQFNDDDNNGRIDEDDALDLAVTNFGDPFDDYRGSGVSVLLNDGSGSFSTKVNVPAGDGPAGVAAADLDGDGDFDLAVANFASDDISILLNLGNGSFVRWPESLPAGTGAYAVTASDMDGDGDPDLIVTNATPDHLAVLRNLSVPGKLAFTPPQSFGVGDFPTSISFSVTAGAFNDDDAVDLAVANGEANNVAVLLNSVYPGAHRVTLSGVDPVGGIDFGSQLKNEPPTLNAIADPVPIEQDAGEQTVNLIGIGAGGSETQPLAVTATSDNPGLIPDPTVNYTFPASTGSLVYTPATGQSGTAVITVTVTDGGWDGLLETGFDNKTYLRTFTVTVNPAVATAGITVIPTGELVTTEVGGTAQFTVVLDSRPTHDVTIGLSSSDTTEGSVSPPALIFTAANWNTAQVVALTGVNDDLDDGDVAYTIVTSAAVSGDTKYNGLNAADVWATNTDDDTAGITVIPTAGLVTSEAGGTAQFTVVLDSQPTHDVTIGLSSSDTTEGTVSPSALIFTAANWNTAQVVALTGVNDDLDDGDVAYTIVTSVAVSGDTKYNGLNAADVWATNTDDDTAVDLGIIGFGVLEGLDPASGDLWYRLETIHPGVLTIEALVADATGGVSLELFESVGSDTPLAISAPVDAVQRIDHPVGSGETYLVRLSGNASDVDLRVANLLNRVGTTVTVYGTDGDDTFEFDAAASRDVSINGVRYELDGTGVESITFDGGDGYDTANLVSLAAGENDSAELWPDRGTFNSAGVTTTLTDVESIDIDGGDGEDTVIIHDSAGDDALYARAATGAQPVSSITIADYNDDSTFVPSYSHSVADFEILTTYSTEGVDVASFYDSDDDDTFVGRQFETVLSGNGFNFRAENYNYTHGYAKAGGDDLAELYDTPQNDRFKATPVYARMFRGAFQRRAKFFETVVAYATAGGRDDARLWDSAAADKLEATRDETRLYNGAGFDLTVKSFDEVLARASGGFDTATFIGSAGDDLLLHKWLSQETLVKSPKTQMMDYDPDGDHGKVYEVTARRFDRTTAVGGQGGYDIAKFWDTLDADRFVVGGDTASMYNPDNELLYDAIAFDRVMFNHVNGGNDKTEKAADYDFLLGEYWAP